MKNFVQNFKQMPFNEQVNTFAIVVAATASLVGSVGYLIRAIKK